MLKIIRTDSSNREFLKLVAKLDADLKIKDGDDHDFYNQYNKVDRIKHVVLAYDGEVAIGCGAIKEFDFSTMEIKRMFVEPEFRNRGIASRILEELEKWSVELGYSFCILETGKKQKEALRLYRNREYTRIPNYGQYAGVDNSECYRKKLVLLN